MAYDTAREHLARFVIRDGLFRHKCNGFGGTFKIVSSSRIALGKSRGAKLQIGKIHIDVRIDALERRNEGIAA